MRHGEVEARYQRVFGGKIDMDLSPEGVEQTRRLAAHSSRLKIDYIYVSPLKRARLSVDPLAQALAQTPTVLPDLREVDFGAWTGLHWDEVMERFGVSAFDWLTELDRGGIPEAEPIASYASRVETALRQIIHEQTGKTVAVMCHGGVIRMLLAILLELPLPKTAAFEIDYASLTIVDYRPRKRVIELLNFTPWRDLT